MPLRLVKDVFAIVVPNSGWISFRLYTSWWSSVVVRAYFRATTFNAGADEVEERHRNCCCGASLVFASISSASPTHSHPAVLNEYAATCARANALLTMASPN